MIDVELASVIGNDLVAVLGRLDELERLTTPDGKRRKRAIVGVEAALHGARAAIERCQINVATITSVAPTEVISSPVSTTTPAAAAPAAAALERSQAPAGGIRGEPWRCEWYGPGLADTSVSMRCNAFKTAGSSYCGVHRKAVVNG